MAVSLGALGLAETLSASWWLAAAVLLLSAEQFVLSATLIWTALAAAVTALAVWLVPDLSGMARVAIFVGVFGASALIGQTMVSFRRRDGARPMADLVGREGTVREFSFHEGLIEIDGTTLPARLANTNRTPPPGARVRVVAADGIVVWVRQVDDGVRQAEDPGRS